MIEIVRGDTLKLSFTRLDSNGDAIKSTPSAIYFTVKDSTSSNTVLFQKTIEDMSMNSETGKWTFYITPSDTNELYYGSYKYDIEVKDILDEQEYTKTIAIGDFKIKEEVTFVSDEV